MKQVGISIIESTGFTPRTSVEGHRYYSKKRCAKFEFIYEDNIKVGIITPSRKGLYIDSDYEFFTFLAPTSLKNKVKQVSDEMNVSMEKLLFKIISSYFNME